MQITEYDAVVVGARVAGAPTAMLLARKGYRVLLLDRARFPSDTMSTHMLTLDAMASLDRWGLLDQVIASGAEPTTSMRFDCGDFALEGWYAPADGPQVVYSPRRHVLDTLLVEAAVEAGVDFRAGYSVDEVIVEAGRVVGVRGRDDAGGALEVRAGIVIGADGRNSRIAALVGAREYDAVPPKTMTYYSYYENLPMEGRFEVFIVEGGLIVAAPTSGGQTVVGVMRPVEFFHEFRQDVEGSFAAMVAKAPAFEERLGRADRVERFVGTAVVDNVCRVPYGPGWALVGDAGLHNDPTFGQGITYALRDAETLVDAIDRGFREVPMEEALARFHEIRDTRSRPMYDLIVEVISGPEDVELFRAMLGNQEQIDRQMGVILGTVPVAEFYSPENMDAIMAAAQEAAPTVDERVPVLV